MGRSLLIKRIASQSLDMFVSSLKEIIGCPVWEERSSASYADERYFLCRVLGLEVTVAIADDNEFKDLDFWVFFKPTACILRTIRSLTV
jgi:hypothetical protein